MHFYTLLCSRGCGWQPGLSAAICKCPLTAAGKVVW